MSVGCGPEPTCAHRSALGGERLAVAVGAHADDTRLPNGDDAEHIFGRRVARHDESTSRGPQPLRPWIHARKVSALACKRSSHAAHAVRRITGLANSGKIWK